MGTKYPEGARLPQASSVVAFVTRNGQVRPAIVVHAFPPTDPEHVMVNAVAFLDGSNDATNDPPGDSSRLVAWVTSVNYSAEKTPFTWHWPE